MSKKARCKKISWQTFKSETARYFYGEKEIWEFDCIATILMLLVRVFYFFIFIFIIILPFFMLLLAILSIKIEYLGVLFGAIAAGIFTMIASLSNTEANLRNIRCAWIEDSRNDFINYMSVSRKFLSISNVLTWEEARLRKSEQNDRGDGIIKSEKHYEQALLDYKNSVREFFEVYARLSLRFRGKKNGSEGEVHEIVDEHYQQYKKIAEDIRSSDIDDLKGSKLEERTKDLDKSLNDFFGSYFDDEWKRAKKGDSDILNRKKALFAVLVILAFSFAIYFVLINSKDKEGYDNIDGVKVDMVESCHQEVKSFNCI